MGVSGFCNETPVHRWRKWHSPLRQGMIVHPKDHASKHGLKPIIFDLQIPVYPSLPLTERQVCEEIGIDAVDTSIQGVYHLIRSI